MALQVATKASGAQGTSSAPAGRVGSTRRRRGLIAWLFMVPLLAVNLLVIVAPALESVYYSFTNWTGIGGAKFIGVRNFRTMFTSGQFWNAMLHNVLWTVFFLIVPIALGLAGAFMLSRIKRFQILFRVIYFIPYILATIISAVVWENLLSPTSGIGIGIEGLGIHALANTNFLGNPSLALPTVAFVNNWQWWGFLVVMFLAAMTGTDPALYEAARIDGASAWQEFRRITIPSIRPTLMFLSLMTIIWSFLIFDYIYIMTQGGPADATQVVGTLMYQEAFQDQAAGYASAMGLTLGFISICVVVVYTRLRKRGWNV
jgi:raffinose/stachyose/melibiose transport system permease protein